MIKDPIIVSLYEEQHMEGFKRKQASASIFAEKHMEGFNWFIQHLLRQDGDTLEYELFFFTSKELALRYFKAYHYAENQHNFIEPLENIRMVSLPPSDVQKYFYYEYAL